MTFKSCTVEKLLVLCLYWYLGLGSGFSTNAEIQPDQNLKVFQDCLLYWRLFKPLNFNTSVLTMFYKLQALYYSKTPLVLQIGNFTQPVEMAHDPYTISTLQDPAPHTKHCKCRVLFLEIHSLYIVPYWDRYGEGDVDFVLYFSNQPNNLIIEFLTDNLKLVNYSGVPLFLNNDGNLEFVDGTQRGILIQTNIKSLYDLTCHYNKFHQKLDGLVVQSDSNGWEFCGRENHEVAPTSAITCLLMSRLNISYLIKPFVNIRSMDLLNNVLYASGIGKIISGSQSSIYKYDFPIPSIQLKQWMFLVVTRSVFQKSASAITDPFEPSVWTFILVSMFLMPVALMITTFSSTSSLSMKNYFNWIFLSLAAMAGQCNDTVNRLFKSWKSAELWILWNVFTLIISNCYDGQLYSFLASDYYPLLPDSLKELAGSQLPLVTFSTNWAFRNGSLKDSSSLQALLQPNLQVYRLPEYYNLLAQRIQYISLIQSLENVTRDILDDKGSVKYATLAVVESDFYGKLIQPLLELSGAMKVIKRISINNFHSYEGWILRKYFAYNRFQRVLWQIVEGGFRRVWDENKMIFSQYLIAKSVLSKETVGSKNMMAYFMKSLKGQGSGQDKKAEWETEPNPMKLALLRMVFRICGIAWGIGGASLLAENMLTLYYIVRHRTLVKIIYLCRRTLKML